LAMNAQPSQGVHAVRNVCSAWTCLSTPAHSHP
jgi:hypothetical protein